MEFTLEFERSSDIIGVARSRGTELIFDTGRGIDKQGLWPMEVLVASLGGCLNLDLGVALQESDYAVDRSGRAAFVCTRAQYDLQYAGQGRQARCDHRRSHVVNIAGAFTVQ
jgi:organic hydroperoxide reductase OsmC/OhrA